MGLDPNRQDQQNFQQNPACQQYTKSPQTPPDKRSRPMTTAAVILSIIAISTVCCIYLSLICGILGIIFALLSKGGEWTMSSSAKTALIISLFAVIITLLLTIGSFALIIIQYGSINAFWEEYMQMMETYRTMSRFVLT